MRRGGKGGAYWGRSACSHAARDRDKQLSVGTKQQSLRERPRCAARIQVDLAFDYTTVTVVDADRIRIGRICAEACYVKISIGTKNKPFRAVKLIYSACLDYEGTYEIQYFRIEDQHLAAKSSSQIWKVGDVEHAVRADYHSARMENIRKPNGRAEFAKELSALLVKREQLPDGPSGLKSATYIVPCQITIPLHGRGVGDQKAWRNR
jgi:hypothetical protein